MRTAEQIRNEADEAAELAQERVGAIEDLLTAAEKRVEAQAHERTTIVAAIVTGVSTPEIIEITQLSELEVKAVIKREGLVYDRVLRRWKRP